MSDCGGRGLLVIDNTGYPVCCIEERLTVVGLTHKNIHHTQRQCFIIAGADP